MGLISRKLFPACESMCVCCPALRSRSRQPVKRYKKLLSEIFPKSLDGPTSERKIVKLCEYAAKNPFRIPKIAKYLEERCYKELRYEHIKFINIVMEAYNKLLCICKGQMAYFAVSLLNVVTGLLDNSKQDAVQIIGCQTLTRFIYSQADGTYMHNIEKLVHKVCALAHEKGDEHERHCLRASSLQCLSAMVWFMGQFSHIFDDFGEIVHGTLDNYEPDAHSEGDVERGEPHHNWVNEVVRCEGRGGAVASCDTSPSCMIMRPRPEKKDPSILTREEIETPKVWAQICIQRMVELAKESSTMRRVLDPMFVYFDLGRHWIPRQGLATMVLSDMSYFMESSGNQQLILGSLIRHLDHKNVAHDPQLKSYVIQVATALARQIRSGVVLAEIGFVCDLCRHLRKSLQATVESVGEQESNSNILLQNSIEDCLLETAKGIADARPLFDLMAITVEKFPSGGVARATIGSLMILAHMISVVSASSRSQQVFPEALLIQLLKVMLHPDVEARVGAHQIFSALLIPSSSHPRHEVASLRSGFLDQPRRWHSNTASASVTALLEKLRREKDGTKVEKHGNNVHDDFKERDSIEEDWKQGRARKNSPNFYKFSSIIDRSVGSTSLSEAEPHIMKFNEDQIAQLLSAFWMQASLPDNLPSNIEAIGHSFVLTLISSGLKNMNDNLVVRFFQLPLSLRNISLDPNNGILPPACQRSIFVLSTGMLMFMAKIYHIPDLNDLLKTLVPYDVDPYLGISDDLQVYVKPQVDIREYGSVTDNQLATSLLFELRNKIYESDNVIMDILVQSLSSVTELEVDDLTKQVSESFQPDAFMLGPQSILEFDHNQMVSHSQKSLSFDGDFPMNSLVADDAISEASVADLSRFVPKMHSSPSMPHVISIGQLLESALEVAGQVAGTSVTTSPLPYNTMASQCEALGTGTRKKLSNWLAHEHHQSRALDKSLPVFAADGHLALEKITSSGGPAQVGVMPHDPWLAMRLPPASPFDNFLTTMASASLAFPSLQPKFQSPRRSPKPSTRRIVLRPITASVSETPPVSVQPVTPPEPTQFPIREVPGSYGIPFIGPINDRLDYFYKQGREEFFKSRVQKYQSTVFRANMPPGPFIASDTRVVVLLDGKSFPVLFDVTKVEKKNLFTGTYMPSTDLTGGYRVLSYLDPSEPSHGKLKQLLFFLLKSRRDHVIPEFHSSYVALFEGLENELATKGKAAFGDASDQAAFNFLARALYGANPAETKLGLDGPKLIGKWVLFQLAPLLSLGLPVALEELLIHTFRLPSFLVKADYKRLYDFFYESSGFVLDEAERLGVSRDEACHNLLFATCFNSFGGMKFFFPNMIKHIGRAGVKLHTQLAAEIRSVIRSNGGKVTMAAVEQMPLMKSVVYESLRIEPPVALQYGRAKRDLIIESHDAAFKVKEGQMLFGYQPFATKDPKIFDRAEEFVPDRFVGDGERLLDHVLWSNGPETETPTVENKQCAGKDFVVLASRLLVVELFLRYDSFEFEIGRSALGATVTITSLKRATF